ncbi:SWIM zinc finger family protein [Streptomyces sp. HUAS TT20]|uniref:SWIM zinc finger family protein n=1 Tax=Streptomyces sp. HUAS TT20 TaxID=3447509 RepID=UPI0021D9BBD3|nr:SWIM zinc finger family protein [Streptomyces sp. HUAS 15-9]UXY30815.1 SWIM zinc finger family protein [Streptomyces sp. HUAS 15-9]
MTPASGQPRPGDVVRRALREARDRASGAKLPGGETDGTAGTQEAPAVADEARPGDVARSALRQAISARHDSGADADDGDGTAEATAEGAGDDRPTAHPGRPGDVARKALRTARKEAAKTAAQAETSAPDAPRRPPSPSRSGGTGHVDRARVARDVRQLLANGFRMPSSADDPEPSTKASRPTADDDSRPDRPSPPPTTPTPPPVPRTMATPHRDGELRRTFPAFPPRTSPEGAGFAETWWGNAWVDALEQGALDVKRLARGRGYAAQGHVDAITVTPGLLLAYVQGSRPRPYRVQVRLRTLAEADWERFLDAAADRPGHIAALLDKELPQSLTDCGVPLLPGPGDLEPRCSCPDSGHPCKHAAALCYQTARLLDADPFVLLLLRGRGERELLDALSRRNAARAARAAQEQGPAPLPGVRAADALAPRELPPLPPPLPVPPHPEQPPVYPASPGGPDPFALDQLATDAAARAHALLGSGRDPVGELTLWQDAVRLAAARPGSGLTAGTRALYSSLASAAGRTPAELARAVAAWRQGGLDGLTVLEEPWDPPAGRFDRARPLLLAADLPAFRPWRNHLTHPHGHVQLRLGRDGLWYAYESEPGRDDWWPRGTPDLDPVGALTGLGTPGDL